MNLFSWNKPTTPILPALGAEDETSNRMPSFGYACTIQRELGFGTSTEPSGLAELTVLRRRYLADPQDDMEYIAGELQRQTKAGINPCGSEFWDPRWDDPKSPF